MGTYLFTADLHLTLKPSEAYRWEIFSWLQKRAFAKKVDAIIIAGDITHAKDNHGSKLVNQIVEELIELSGINGVTPIYVLMGNHDYADPEVPFLHFINSAPSMAYSGGSPIIRFIHKPTELTISNDQFLFLPHARNVRAWDGIPFDQSDFVIFHQPLIGSVGANGYALDGGIAPGVFDKCKPDAKVIGGDIHVPQQVKRAIYCGSPYPVNFGDNFDPRVLYWDGTTLQSIPRLAIHKRTIEVSSLDELIESSGLVEGDKAKITIVLPRSEFSDWQERKAEVEEYCKELGVELCGIDLKPAAVEEKEADPDLNRFNAEDRDDVLAQYCDARGIDESLLDAGLAILEEVS